jgi:hypothetical protein
MAVVEPPQSLDEKTVTKNDLSSGANSTDGNGELVLLDPKEDRRLTTRIDMKVIPILGLLYLICFLDRTNIANAKIAGLEAGLDMPSTGYNTALWIFYIPFVLAEIPSNMIMAMPQIKPNLFLGTQCFILGKLASFIHCILRSN